MPPLKKWRGLSVASPDRVGRTFRLESKRTKRNVQKDSVVLRAQNFRESTFETDRQVLDRSLDRDSHHRSDHDDCLDHTSDQ